MSDTDKKLTAVIVAWIVAIVFACCAPIFTVPGTTFIDYLQLVGSVTLGLIGVCILCGLFILSIYWATKDE